MTFKAVCHQRRGSAPALRSVWPQRSRGTRRIPSVRRSRSCRRSEIEACATGQEIRGAGVEGPNMSTSRSSDIQLPTSARLGSLALAARIAAWIWRRAKSSSPNGRGRARPSSGWPLDNSLAGAVRRARHAEARRGRQVVEQLAAAGIENVHLLTGDNALTAASIAQAGWHPRRKMCLPKCGRSRRRSS